MKTRILMGHYRDESGLLEPGKLLLIDDGSTFRDEGGYAVRAAEFAVATGIAGVEIKSDGGAWEFLPDAGECERIGLTVR